MVIATDAVQDLVAREAIQQVARLVAHNLRDVEFRHYFTTRHKKVRHTALTDERSFRVQDAPRNSATPAACAAAGALWPACRLRPVVWSVHVLESADYSVPNWILPAWLTDCVRPACISGACGRTAGQSRPGRLASLRL